MNTEEADDSLIKADQITEYPSWFNRKLLDPNVRSCEHVDDREFTQEFAEQRFAEIERLAAVKFGPIEYSYHQGTATFRASALVIK